MSVPAQPDVPEGLQSVGAPSVPERCGDEQDFVPLLKDLIRLLRYVRRFEASHGHWLSGVEAHHALGARNLLHYVALRQHDLRSVQKALAAYGLSSLGRSESTVLHSIGRVVRILALLAARVPGRNGLSDADRAELEALGAAGADPVHNESESTCTEALADRLFGVAPLRRTVRIMATVGGGDEAGEHPDVVERIGALAATGTDVFRINTGRDDLQCWTTLVQAIREAQEPLGRKVAIMMDLGGPKLRVVSIERHVKSNRKRFNLSFDEATYQLEPQKCLMSLGEIVEVRFASPVPDLTVGHRLNFDDGLFECRFEEASEWGGLCRVTRLPLGGKKLKTQKGANLPDTPLVFGALTPKDQHVLETFADRVDIFGVSFVRTVADVHQVASLLKAVGRTDLGVIFKIETRQAVENLPALLLAAMRLPRVGIMIARGDLATEISFERLAEVQEEILWFCEAAHLPVVWATQVLENLTTSGLPPRSEVTDAAMAGRAECVMLNKGKYRMESVRFLDDVLRRMAEHSTKRFPLMRRLSISNVPEVSLH